MRGRGRARRRRRGSPTCRWRGWATSLYTLVAEPGGRLLRATARRARRRCSATCASWARPRVLAPPRIWENMLTSVQVRAADATPLKRRVFELLPSRRRARRRSCARTASPCPPGSGCSCALGEFFVYGPIRDQLGLRRARWASPAARRSGPTPSASSAPSASTSSRSTAPPRSTGLVSLQPDAEANPDDARAGRARASRCKIADRGEVLVRERGDLQGLLQERGGHARGHRPRGLVPHRRRRLHRSARAPGHHRPRQGRGRHAPTARPSRPSSSRTSSSSARTSARRWPSATSGRSWPP